MEYLWGLGITELQLVVFEVTTDEFFSAADAMCSQDVLQRERAVSGAMLMQGRRKSVFA